MLRNIVVGAKRSQIRFLGSNVAQKTTVAKRQGGRGHVRPRKPKMPIPRTSVLGLNLKSVNKESSKTDAERNRRSEEILDKVNKEEFYFANWKKYLDSMKKGDENASIRSILEHIIKFSEYSKVNALEPNEWRLLKKQVVLYDNMVGPLNEETGGHGADGDDGRLQIPGNIKDVILYCREKEDYANMVSVYDMFFQVLIKGPMMRAIEHREELVRIHGNDMDENSNEHGSRIGELIDRLDDICVNELCRDKAVEIMEKRLVEQIEREWYQLEKPRNLNIYHHTSYNKLVRLLSKKGYLDHFQGEFVNEFIKDLVTSEMGFEYDELNILFRNILRFEKICPDMYLKFREDVIQNMGMVVTPEIYKIFLESCIKNNELGLFERILGDFRSEGFSLDRRMFQLLQEYYSRVGDAARLLKVMELEIMRYNLPLFLQDWEVMVNCLVRVGYRSAAVDLVKSLIIVNQGVERAEDADADAADAKHLNRLQDPATDLDMMVSFNSETIMTRPEITGALVAPVLVTCGDLAEFESLRVLLDGYAQTSQSVLVELLVKDKFSAELEAGGAGFRWFQESIFRALNGLPIGEIDALLAQRDFWAVVARVAERMVRQAGDAAPDELLEAYGAVLQLGERPQDPVVGETDLPAGAALPDPAAAAPLECVASLRHALRHSCYQRLLRHVLAVAGITA